MRTWFWIGCVILGALTAFAQQRVINEPLPVADGIATTPLLIGDGVPMERLSDYVPPSPVYLPPTKTPPNDWEGYQHPFFVAGYVAPAPPDLIRSFRWFPFRHGDITGQVGVLVLRSQNAHALRLQFSRGTWHPRAEIRVFDPTLQVAFGPLRPEWDEEGNWWTTIIFGDQIGIEIFVPDEMPLSELPPITAVAYHFRGYNPSDFAPASGCPPLDVACYDEWVEVSRSVCMLAVISGGVSGFCSGAALRRNPIDAEPYFAPIVMTANHCSPGSNTSLIWDYQNSVCNGTPPNPNTLPRNSGITVLKRHSASDWILMGTRSALLTSFYAGWSPLSWANGESAVSISHPMSPPPPGGPYKRIAFATKTGNSTCGSSQTWTIRLSEGTIAQGSSGSPIFDSVRRVRGTASCANACLLQDPKCCPPSPSAVTYYGRMDTAFPIIRWYLFQMANPCYVDRSFPGDSNNAGDTERGIETNPFNTLYEGITCVPAGGTVLVRPGNYNERLLFWRPMVIERAGDSGVVVIGAP